MLIIVLLGLAILTYICLPRPTFVINIRDSTPLVTRGKVSKSFLNACQSIVDASSIKSGKIKGFGHGNNTTLKFSSNIPQRCHQRFKNAWHVSGR